MSALSKTGVAGGQVPGEWWSLVSTGASAALIGFISTFFIVLQGIYNVRPVDFFRNLEGGIEFADAVLLHQLVALRFLFRLGHDERQVQAWWHGAEQQFHRLSQDHAFRESPCLLPGREHQGLL